MTVYSALYNLLKANNKLPLVTSGFIQDSSKSYVILSKTVNSLENLDTCLRRLDQSIYQINIYDTSLAGLLDKLASVEETLENQTLNLTTKRFVSLLRVGGNLSEPVQGFYGGFLTFEIMTQKEFSSSYQRSKVSAKTFQEALYIQYRNHASLNNKLNGFVSTKYGKEDWDRPFLFIPNYKIEEDFRTTCLTKGENYEFSISVEGHDPDELERIIDEIDNVYSYISLSLTGNRRFTNLEWTGDTLVEVEPDLWLGSVNYNLLLEKI